MGAGPSANKGMEPQLPATQPDGSPPVPRLPTRDVFRLTAEQRNQIVATALADLGKGYTLDQLEVMHGLDAKTIRYWLATKVPEKYEAARLRGIATRIIESDDKLEAATDHAEITKRSHQCRYARWDAERLAARIYGQKQELTVIDATPPPDITELARRVAFITEQARLNPKPATEPIDVTPITTDPITTHST